MDEQTVRHIATISRLVVSDDEVPGFASDFSEVLGIFEKLDEVECEGEAVLPIEPVPELRNDSNANPARAGKVIKGPRTVE